MIALCVELLEFDVMPTADFFEDPLQAIEMRRIKTLPRRLVVKTPLGRKDQVCVQTGGAAEL